LVVAEAELLTLMVGRVDQVVAVVRPQVEALVRLGKVTMDLVVQDYPEVTAVAVAVPVVLELYQMEVRVYLLILQALLFLVLVVEEQVVEQIPAITPAALVERAVEVLEIPIMDMVAPGLQILAQVAAVAAAERFVLVEAVVMVGRALSF
jgi:hypothetical protein